MGEEGWKSREKEGDSWGVGGPERVPKLAGVTPKPMAELRYAGGIRPRRSNQQRHGGENGLNRERTHKGIMIVWLPGLDACVHSLSEHSWHPTVCWALS